MKTKKLLEKYNIKPNPMKDQFFLDDKKVIRKMVSFADLNKKDIVLEIGAGTGNLTKEIAKKAGKVIAFEIDTRFKPILDKLPSNVEIHYENAWDFVQLQGKFKKAKVYNKVVASPPYSFLQPFLHNLTFLVYDKVILLAPIKFVDSIKKSGIFSSFFKPEIKFKIKKDKFYPQPDITSAVIDLHKLPDPIENKKLGLFLRQYIYKHEQQLVKNSLMEGLIKYCRWIDEKMLTKNKAREIINNSGIPQKYLKRKPNTFKIYFLVGQKLNSLPKI